MPRKEADMSSRPRNTVAAALLALALTAPPATARPIVEPPLQEDVTAPPQVIVRADEGFDWGSAGIGAAATGALVLVAGGIAVSRRARPAS
jgi:hypothetical protein